MGFLSRIFAVGRGLTKKAARSIMDDDEDDPIVEAELNVETARKPNAEILGTPPARTTRVEDPIPEPEEEEKDDVADTVQITERDGSKRSL